MNRSGTANPDQKRGITVTGTPLFNSKKNILDFRTVLPNHFIEKAIYLVAFSDY
jgi:hypothetical protein